MEKRREVLALGCAEPTRDKMNIIRTLLFAGAAMPVLYFLALFVAGALYPD